MQAIAQSYRGLGLLITLNRDWLLSTATILAALGFGAFLGSLLH